MKLTPRIQIIVLGAGLFLLAGGLAISRGANVVADELRTLALGLAIILTAAALGGDAARRAGQPAVLGEVLAGVLLGNLPGVEKLHALGTGPYIDMLSRIGMLLLLFEVGLDLSVRDLFDVGASSLLVAVIGTVATIVIGSGAAALTLPGSPAAVHIFFGAAITATSVGITARVLRDLGASRSSEARIILGAAVFDDILGLVVLGILSGSLAGGTGGGFGGLTIVGLVAKTLGFLALAIALGSKVAPAWFRRVAQLRTRGALLAFGLGFCFALSWAAGAIGLAPLIGAFAAGLVLEEAHFDLFVQRGEPALGELVGPIASFLVPVFFVLVGFHANVRPLFNLSSVLFPLALTLAAIVGKLCCGLGVLDRKARKLTVGVGMIPRGEVTLVFAALGGMLQLHDRPLLDDRGYAALVTVVILTTVLTPPLLNSLVRRAPRAETAGREPG